MKTTIITLICLFILQNAGTLPVMAENKADSQETSYKKSASMKTFALRLKPGQDLRESLEDFIKVANIQAGFIITAVGSINNATLRMADEKEAKFAGKFEVVSLTGTLSQDGVHLHIALSDKSGKTIGGHLLPGCEIYTTAEIIIGELDDLFFSREDDAETGFKELKIYNK